MGRPLRVLIAEESWTQAEQIVRELRSAGFSPDSRCATTETEFLTRLDSDTEIVICDFDAGAFCARRAVELLRERDPGEGIPAVIIAREESLAAARKLGAARVVPRQRLAELGQAIYAELLRRADRAVHEAQRLRELAIVALPAGMVISDVRGTVLYANDGFTRLTGYRRQEIVGRSCAILQGPSTDPAVRERIRKAIRERKSFEGEILNYRKGGTPFWNELAISPIGNHEGFVGLLRDVTGRRNAQAANVADSSGNGHPGVWELDLIRNESVWDERMLGIYGLPAESAPGTLESWHRYIHPEDLKQCHQLRAEAEFNRRRDFDVEFRIFRADDGSLRHIRASALIHYDAQGTALRMIGTNQDVTRLRSPAGGKTSLSSPTRPPPREEPVERLVAPPTYDGNFAKRFPLEILLVDDNATNLKLAMVVLQRLGYKPRSVNDGSEAVDFVSGESIHCILMDLEMPEMDGITAAAAIRQQEAATGAPPTFIAALTANMAPSNRRRCMEAGMDDYLNKPMQIQALSRVLIRAYEKSLSTRPRPCLP